MPGTPTIQVTPKGLAQITSSTSQIIQVAKRMPTLFENVARLTSLIMKTAKKPVPNTYFGHNEQEPLPFIFTFNGANESSAQTTLTKANFTNGTALLPGDVIYNATDSVHERIVITPATADNADLGATFTVTRNTGGTSGGLLQTGDVLIRLAPARSEGVTIERMSKTTQEAFKAFRLQNLNWTKKYTEPALAAATWNEPTRVNEQKKMMIEAKIDMELWLYFSIYSADVGDATTSWARPMSMGLDQFVEANGTVRSINMLTFDEIEKTLETPYYYGATEGFIWACSPRIGRVISAMARGQLVTKQGDSTYGTPIKSLSTSYGDVDLLTLPLLAGNATLNGMGWLIPKPINEYIIMRYLSGNGENHDWRLFTDTQTKASQVHQDEVRTWAGFEFYEGYKFAKIKDVIG